MLFPGAAPHCPAPAKYAQDFSQRSGRSRFPVARCITTAMRGLDWWDQNPFIGGSYGCYQIGNYTEFAGIESVRQGNVQFFVGSRPI